MEYSPQNFIEDLFPVVSSLLTINKGPTFDGDAIAVGNDIRMSDHLSHRGRNHQRHDISGVPGSSNLRETLLELDGHRLGINGELDFEIGFVLIAIKVAGEWLISS